MTPQSFGGQLRKLREQRRITLGEIAQRTKVSVGLLRSLESGGCEGWPGGIYSRGYVRAYARAIGVDPEEVLAAFLECYPAFAPEAGAGQPALPDSAPQTPIERIKAALAGWFGSATETRGDLEELARVAEHRLPNQRQWQRAQPDEGVME